jgi:hypothetical protein
MVVVMQLAYCIILYGEMHKSGVTENGFGEMIAKDIILRSWIVVGNEEMWNVVIWVQLMPHMKHTCSCTALKRTF